MLAFFLIPREVVTYFSDRLHVIDHLIIALSLFAQPRKEGFAVSQVRQWTLPLVQGLDSTSRAAKAGHVSMLSYRQIERHGNSKTVAV